VGAIDVNAVEEARLEAGIGLVARLFPPADREAIRLSLMRAVYGVTWGWIAARTGVDKARARRLAARGRALLDEAVERGQLTEEQLADALRVAPFTGGAGDGGAGDGPRRFRGVRTPGGGGWGDPLARLPPRP
jgi:hypothetical protein